MNLPNQPLPCNVALPSEFEANQDPEAGQRGWCTPGSRTSASVPIALPTFFREPFLFVEYLSLELFSSLFHIGVTSVVWEEKVPLNLFQWDFVFSIKVHLAQQNDVLATDEEKTDPLFGENVLVVYPFDSVLQN